MAGFFARLFKKNKNKKNQVIETEPTVSGGPVDEEATSFLWGSQGGGFSQIFRVKLTDIEKETISYEAKISSFIMLGRDVASCDIVIPNDMTVSRKHCKIVKEQDEFFVQDMESTTGTYLNSRSVGTTPVQMKEGDELTIGAATYRFTIV